MSDGPDRSGDGSDGPSDDSEDPFDTFDEHRDRGGDPFASLGEDTDDESDADTGRDPDPFDYGESPGRGPTDDGAERAAGETGPQGDIADPLAGVEVSEGDPFESSASAFERTDVEGIDPDSVWERLTADPDEEADDADAASAAGGLIDGTPADHDEVVEVSKHSYCEGCPHFSAPPDVGCGHEGTEIIEFVDVDTVRLADCPVVAERRELEDDT